jgi:hypothetical protein
LDQYANNHLTTQASQSTIINLNYGDMNEWKYYAKLKLDTIEKKLWSSFVLSEVFCYEIDRINSELIIYAKILYIFLIYVINL